MQVEFDPAKDAKNIAKHGVSLTCAAGFDWDSAIAVEDDRFDYGERRFYAIGFIEDRLFTMIYTDGTSDETFRVISLRRSNRSEVKHYEAQM